MSAGITYFQSAEDPPLQLWWFDEDGNLIDFSTGYTFTFKLGAPGGAAALTKTSGITGAAGSGTETSGVPNVKVTFSAGELDALKAGPTTAQLVATKSGRDRVMQFPFRLSKVVS